MTNSYKFRWFFPMPLLNWIKLEHRDLATFLRTSLPKYTSYLDKARCLDQELETCCSTAEELFSEQRHGAGLLPSFTLEAKSGYVPGNEGHSSLSTLQLPERQPSSASHSTHILWFPISKMYLPDHRWSSPAWLQSVQQIQHGSPPAREK